MIAVLLVLMALVLPSFLGTRSKAQDSAAQSAVTVAYHDAKAAWADNSAYPLLTGTSGLVAQLSAAEPAFTFMTGTPAVAAKDVSVSREDAQTVTLCAKSASGLFFCLRANEDGTELTQAAAPADGPVFQAAAAQSVYRSVATTAALAKCLLPKLPDADSEDCSALPGEGALGWSATSISKVSGGGGGEEEPPAVDAPSLSWDTTLSSSRATTASVAFTVSDPAATLTCSLDSTPLISCASPITLTDLPVGSHTLTVGASNAGGSATPLSVTWSVYGTPSVAITSGPAEDSATYATSASFGFTTDGADSVECKLDAGAYSACSSPKALSGLALGSHTFTVKADSPGGAPATASRTWRVVAAPTVSITGGPAEGSSSAIDTETFTFTTANADSTTCSLDGAAATPCSSGVSTGILSPGSHTFQVNAVGPLETVSATRTWTVERTYAQEVAASGATHYFRLNETSCAGTAADSAGSASGTYYGSFIGSTTLTCGASGSGPLTGASGSTNKYLSKTSGGGSNGGGKVGTPDFSTGTGLWFGSSSSWAGADSTDAGTVEVWFKTGDASAGSHFVYDKYGATAAFFSSGTLNVYSYSGAVSREFSGLADNQWHHLVVATNGSSIRIVIDGVQQVNNSTNGSPNNAKPFSFGYRGTGGDGSITNIESGTDRGYFFTGSLDEIAFYSTQLSLAEIQTHYNARTR